MSGRPYTPRRLLIVRNDRVGDLVMTLPTFEAARRAFPGALIAALVNPRTAPLLRGNEQLDGLIPDEPALGGWELGRRLRHERFDAALVVNTNKRNCLAVWRARIPVRVTWAYRPLGFVLGTHQVHLHRSHPPVHESEFALAFLRRLGAAASLAECSPRLHAGSAVRERVRARILADLGPDGPLFGMNPGCGGGAYNWPPGRYAELAARLAEHGRVMVTGGPGERHLLDRVREGLSGCALDRIGFYGDFDLTELAAAIEEADVFTGATTGPTHMAGALGTPAVVLFSAHPSQSPLKWAPFGDRNVLLVAPLEEGENPFVPKEVAESHMARMSVERVVEANLGCLGASSARDWRT